MIKNARFSINLRRYTLSELLRLMTTLDYSLIVAYFTTDEPVFIRLTSTTCYWATSQHSHHHHHHHHHQRVRCIYY